jgi:hypothetical protein
MTDSMAEWPANTNPVLTVLRENFDSGDKWGSNIRFLFSLCDVALEYGVSVPVELQYVPSPFGGDTEAYEYQAITGLLAWEYIYKPLSLERFKKEVEHALKVCARYDSLLRLAGENY